MKLLKLRNRRIDLAGFEQIQRMRRPEALVRQRGRAAVQFPRLFRASRRGLDAGQQQEGGSVARIEVERPAERRASAS
jgi:hypothetical protein